MRCVSSRKVRAFTRGGKPAMQGQGSPARLPPEDLSNSTLYAEAGGKVYGLRSRVWTLWRPATRCGVLRNRLIPAEAEPSHSTQWRYEESEPQ